MFSLTVLALEFSLEDKSFKYGSTFDFSFAPSQIIESKNKNSNYIFCVLERPIEGIADIEYLKSNLKVQNNLGKMTVDFIDKVEIFNTIYKESQKMNNTFRNTKYK